MTGHASKCLLVDILKKFFYFLGVGSLPTLQVVVSQLLLT
jgi:hypothetical protein